MKEYILMEATSSSKKYQKKYKCPYCDLRFIRSKLPGHIQDKHEDLIPEGYTALRVAFNTINNKDHGSCIICGNETAWNEIKGRYERLCEDPACKEKYKQIVAKRNRDKYGTDRLQTDERYASDVQKKALAGRKISGKYKFADGGEVEYVGSYERKLLEFMDKIMKCNSEDILSPGPDIKYMWEGKEHLYIPDFYYIPYNLIIEVKDGQGNKNQNPNVLAYNNERQKAKEQAVIDSKKYSYVKITNNDFSQLIGVFGVLKYQLLEKDPDPVIRINESTSILEGYIFNTKDIYYNKDKFDSGEINLCFITGLSGSGKSTMGRGMKDAEHYELDDVVANKLHFTMNQMKEYGDLIYSFFNGSGKKYWYTKEDVENGTAKLYTGNYEKDIINDFIDYSISYAKSHKGKYVLDGIWLYMYVSPEKLKDYAVYIKGTSALISNIRAAKRDAKSEEKRKIDYAKHFIRRVTNPTSFIDEKDVQKYRDYFSKLMKKDVKESMSGTIGAALPLTPSPIPYESNKDNYYIIQHMQNNVFNYSITKDPTQYTMYSIDPEHGYKVFKSDKNKIQKSYLTFKLKDKRSAKEIYDEISDCFKSGKSVPSMNYIYEKYTGNKIISEDQILFDDKLELIPNFYDGINEICNKLYKYLTPSGLDILEEQVNQLKEVVYFG